jgi:MtN3 and saliva related transmembrane protein
MEIVIGIIAGILTSISMAPQLIKVIKEKDVANISPIMITILLGGVSMWVVYGVLLKEWPIILSNAFSVLVNTTLLTYYLLYRERT